MSQSAGEHLARPGLRLTQQQRAELTEEFRVARGNKDLDMCLRIQPLLLASRGHGIHLEENQKGHHPQQVFSQAAESQGRLWSVIQPISRQSWLSQECHSYFV